MKAELLLLKNDSKCDEVEQDRPRGGERGGHGFDSFHSLLKPGHVELDVLFLDVDKWSNYIYVSVLD